MGATQPRVGWHSVTQEPVAEPDSSPLACTQQSPSTTARSVVQEAAVPAGAGAGHRAPVLRALQPPVGHLGKAFSGPGNGTSGKEHLLVQGTQEAWVPSLRPGRCSEGELGNPVWECHGQRSLPRLQSMGSQGGRPTERLAAPTRKAHGRVCGRFSGGDGEQEACVPLGQHDQS